MLNDLIEALRRSGAMPMRGEYDAVPMPQFDETDLLSILGRQLQDILRSVPTRGELGAIRDSFGGLDEFDYAPMPRGGAGRYMPPGVLSPEMPRLPTMIGPAAPMPQLPTMIDPRPFVGGRVR